MQKHAHTHKKWKYVRGNASACMMMHIYACMCTWDSECEWMLCVWPKCGCSFFEPNIWSCILDERVGQKDGGGHTLTQSAVVCVWEEGGGRGETRKKWEEGERGKMKGEKMEGDRPLSAKTCTDTQEVKISEWKGKCMYADQHMCMSRWGSECE